ncbi:MAG: DUF1501 domain-containing protein [Acidobacteriota bacterium]
MRISRRIFLKNGGLTLIGMGALPGVMMRAALAAPLGRRKTLVVVFLRGGADGLNMVVPYGEKEYYRARPSIAIPPPGAGGEAALDLDGFFGLHPSLSDLQALFQQKRLGILLAVGSPSPSRSHFEAQDFMESAAPDNHRVKDGWLNRFLQSEGKKGSAFRGVSLGPVLPRSLEGRARAIALDGLNHFHLQGGPARGLARAGYQSLYHQETNTLLSGTAQELFDAIDFLDKAHPDRYRPSPNAHYPGGPLGEKLRQLSQLIKAGVGVEVAFVDAGGWDHHFNQGGVKGQQSRLLRELGQGLSAFNRDLGARMEDVLLLTMSEFGRTVAENGSGGTDHGHANMVLALGGEVKGGELYGQWPGLGRQELYEGRDLALTSDFRDVFAEVLIRRMGAQDLSNVLPGFSVDPARFKGFI